MSLARLSLSASVSVFLSLSAHACMHSCMSMCVRVCMCMYVRVCICILCLCVPTSDPLAFQPLERGVVSGKCVPWSRTPGTGNLAGTLLESCWNLAGTFLNPLLELLASWSPVQTLPEHFWNLLLQIRDGTPRNLAGILLEPLQV